MVSRVPITHPVKFYEPALARSRSSPAGSGTSATAAGTRSCERSSSSEVGAGLVPGLHALRYEHWVKGLNGDWLIVAAAVLRRADPALVPDRARLAIEYDHPILPEQATLPIDPTSALPRATTADSGADRAVSWVTRTSWTPGPLLRSPPRSPATGPTTPISSPGSSRWISGPRAPRSSARGSSRRSSARTTSTCRCHGHTP